jgi:hypothetical protein
MAPKKKPQYYTVQFEKFIEIVSETEKTNFMLSDHIKDLVTETPVKDWDNSPVYDFLESSLLINSFRDFLDNKINNPTEEEVEFITKNNIKDVLFSKDELESLQAFFLALESRKEYLLRSYNFSCSIN